MLENDGIFFLVIIASIIGLRSLTADVYSAMPMAPTDFYPRRALNPHKMASVFLINKLEVILRSSKFCDSNFPVWAQPYW